MSPPHSARVIGNEGSVTTLFEGGVPGHKQPNEFTIGFHANFVKGRVGIHEQQIMPPIFALRVPSSYKHEHERTCVNIGGWSARNPRLLFLRQFLFFWFSFLLLRGFVGIPPQVSA